MPKFPRYDSQGTLTTQTPSVGAVQDTSGQITENMAKGFGTAMQVAGQWGESLKTVQDTVFKGNTRVALTDIKSRAESETDPNKLQDYLTEIDKIGQENAKGLPNGSAALREWQFDSQVAKIEMNAIFKKKTVALGQVATKKLIDNVVSSPDNEHYDKSEYIRDLVDKQVAAGIFSPEDGEKIYNQSVKTSAEFDVANDNSTQEEQSRVLAELKKGDSGEYASVPPDTRLDLIKASQQRIFNNNQTYKRDVEDSQKANTNVLIDKIANGTADVKDIESAYAVPEESGGIPRKTLNTYKNAVVGGIQGNLNRMLREENSSGDATKRATDVAKYLDLIDDFTDNETDAWKAKEKLAEAYKDGIINEKEQKFLNDLKTNLKDIEWNRKTDPIAKSIKSLKQFYLNQTNETDDVIASRIKSLVGEIGEGTEPEVAIREMLSQEVLSRIPDVGSIPKTGKIYRDGNGNKIRVFPDGSYEDAVEKVPSA